MGLVTGAALIDRLLPLVQPEPNSGCWLYDGERLSRNGYARVWLAGAEHQPPRRQGREVQLHRLLYELLRAPIASGLVLDHKCRVRCCCNPWHLEPVTVQINTQRGDAVLFAKAA